MKKVLFALVAATMIMVSCTNETTSTSNVDTTAVVLTDSTDFIPECPGDCDSVSVDTLTVDTSSVDSI